MSLVLVVDDASECRNPLSRLLKLEGYETQQARDGIEAMEMISQRMPDLVLLDIIMPRMDGLQCLAAIRAGAATKHLPVIMLSGSQDDQHYADAFYLGANEICRKAVYPADHVVTLIRKLMPIRVAA